MVYHIVTGMTCNCSHLGLWVSDQSGTLSDSSEVEIHMVEISADYGGEGFFAVHMFDPPPHDWKIYSTVS